MQQTFILQCSILYIIPFTEHRAAGIVDGTNLHRLNYGAELAEVEHYSLAVLFNQIKKIDSLYLPSEKYDLHFLYSSVGRATVNLSICDR